MSRIQVYSKIFPAVPYSFLQSRYIKLLLHLEVFFYEMYILS